MKYVPSLWSNYRSNHIQTAFAHPVTKTFSYPKASPQDMNELTIAEDPKQMVWEMMTSFSERMWSARWLSGLEFILWKKVRECSDDLTLREIADFNFYAGLAGGWWMWDNNQKCEVFIEMNQWLALVAQKEESIPQ